MTNGKVNILIVDDKTSNIFALEQLLAKPGRGFINATNGRDALMIVFNKDIDLIILDVQMPDMDGFEVAQIIKTNNRISDVPIIFVSAEKTDHHFVMKGYEEGGIDYLYKPLDPEITKAKVDVLLQLYMQKRELTEKNAALEKYALLINNSADLICIFNAETLKFEELNNAMIGVLEYSVNEMKGTSLLYYLPEEDRLNVQKLCRQNKEKFSFETRVYNKSREIKWLNWNVVNKSGWWFANARDITEIKEVEEIKNYLAAVVKQSNEAIYLHNPDGKIISWNDGAERIYGFSEAEALNMKIWNIVPEHLLAETQEVVNHLLTGAEIQSLHTKRITKHGKIIDVLFSASVLVDANNNLKSIAITERDITEQKQAEAEIKQKNAQLERVVTQLNHVNKELESFSYSVSHDLRAPLRALSGYSQMLQEELTQIMNDEAKRLLNKIQHNARRMGTLIDDLLAFAKLGKKEVQKSVVNMEYMIKEILCEMESSVAHQATITINQLPAAYADHSLIRQVLTNLISNAIKYSSRSGSPQVVIGAFDENNECVYYVQDNGVGFNMEYASKLFGVFQRLHSSEDFEGTGVGLAIVQRIVTKHGGRVWAKGEPGAGATFYFSLPRA